MGKKVKGKLIYLKTPCAACLIAGNAVKEILAKLVDECALADVKLDIEKIELDDLKDIHEIKGLEVEKFPALIINDEQITAGNIPSKKQLLSIIKSLEDDQDETN